MPEKETIARAKRDKARGMAPSSQAGEFVREEIHHIREGKHGARSTKQAIAIGLSKARRAGVKLKPRAGTRDAAEEHKAKKKPSARRSRATRNALKHASHSTASHAALAKQAKSTARKRGPAKRKAAARKAARTRKRNAA